jgi:hypothetical protein
MAPHISRSDIFEGTPQVSRMSRERLKREPLGYGRSPQQSDRRLPALRVTAPGEIGGGPEFSTVRTQ